MSETSDTSPIYRLYGVVVHLDIMNAAFSGHYVCYVKNIQNKWFKIDDSKVCFYQLACFFLNFCDCLLENIACSRNIRMQIHLLEDYIIFYYIHNN